MEPKNSLSFCRIYVIRADGTMADGFFRTSDSSITIGADISNDIRIKVENAEPKHCLIEMVKKTTKVRDLQLV